MTEGTEGNQRSDPEMHTREITLADGRYMIFYTFGDQQQEFKEQIEQGYDV